MEDFNQKASGGELNGFDSVENSENSTTNDAGFYIKQHADIIQDEIGIESEKAVSENIVDTDVKKETESFEKNNTPTETFYADYNSNKQYGGFYVPHRRVDKKRFSVGMLILTAVLAAIIGAVSSIAVLIPAFSPDTISDNKVYDGATQNSVNINIDKTAANVVEAVAEKVTPSVVGIRTTTSIMSFFGGTSETSGDGSGVVYSANGYIITNYHVISGALSGNSGKIEVFPDSSSAEGYPATVVGYNISSDLAVIKINAKNLTPVEFDDSDNLKVGQYVITIGNPGGLEFMDSVTYGVISGLDRVVSSDLGVKLIQTDAAINPGNSGGALVNTNGKLVGINSAKIVSEEFEGMGFAIPSNTVKEICKNIIERENSPEPYIGISISERYTAQVLKYYGYPTGAVILSVADGSPADNAGLQKGDIITEYKGKEITEYTVLEDLIMNSTPDEKVDVKIYRNGRYYSTEIKVGSNNAVD